MKRNETNMNFNLRYFTNKHIKIHRELHRMQMK